MTALSLYSPEMVSVVDQIPTCVVWPVVNVDEFRKLINGSQKATAVKAIATNQCEADVACLCKNEEFLSMLVRAILRACNKPDQDSMFQPFRCAEFSGLVACRGD
jgi:hypothetical protein